MEPKLYSVVEGSTSRTGVKFRVSLTEEDRLLHYPKAKLVASGLPQDQADALAYFVERKFEMATMKEMVAEYNKLTGKSIKKFTNTETAERRLKEARKAAAPKKPTANRDTPRKGRAPAYTEVRMAKGEDKPHRLNEGSQRQVLLAKVEKDSGGTAWISTEGYPAPLISKLVELGHLEGR